MAGPIYKLWMMKYTDAWYQLSEEERNDHNAKIQAALAQVGGKMIISCTPAWSSEQWLMFGVEEYPDVDVVQQHTLALYQLNHFRYVESVSMLGIKWPPE
jgi:hypothetical protein